jgi:hypothetical protein
VPAEKGISLMMWILFPVHIPSMSKNVSLAQRQTLVELTKSNIDELAKSNIERKKTRKELHSDWLIEFE